MQRKTSKRELSNKFVNDEEEKKKVKVERIYKTN
jgi:hypothetical protein